MGKKKTDETAMSTKTKQGAKDAAQDGPREKLLVSAMLVSMDQKPDKLKKGSSSLTGSTASKKNAKAVSKPPSYTDGTDLLPSDDEEEEYGSDEEQAQAESNKWLC